MCSPELKMQIEQSNNLSTKYVWHKTGNTASIPEIWGPMQPHHFW